jgi:threonine/homoserine/homoserine lactone efflux protein
VLALFASGFVTGLLVAIGVGPVNAFCIRRTLVEGFDAGVVSGLGSATADAVSAVIALSGMAAISRHFASHLFLIRSASAAILMVWGISMIVAVQKHDPNRAPTRLRRSTAFAAALSLTFANPANVATIAAAMDALGVGVVPLAISAIALVACGVFLGSCLWWFFVASCVSRFRTRIIGRAFAIVQRGIGVAVLLCGVWFFFG